MDRYLFIYLRIFYGNRIFTIYWNNLLAGNEELDTKLELVPAFGMLC